MILLKQMNFTMCCLEGFTCFTQLTSSVMIHYTIHNDSVVTGVITIQVKEAQLENISSSKDPDHHDNTYSL